MADAREDLRPAKKLTLTGVRKGRAGEVDLDITFDPSFRPGEVIAGRYEVERFLASGGMGEVYRVLDRELGERIALKTILPRSSNDPVSLDRFRREIQIARIWDSRTSPETPSLPASPMSCVSS